MATPTEQCQSLSKRGVYILILYCYIVILLYCYIVILLYYSWRFILPNSVNLFTRLVGPAQI